ncbi:pilus assembly protein TadG-related protein [Pseudomonas serboccidentalis]|uniref:Pilus assembly protein TadG-related protein n=1 Tax=Pseudomonas serboccidentalis TaxID=2964670 RepID=A0ABY7Z5E9_9PSED|nr:pilus assembly protein TadG-related protein [Pseudomonas serboccidentalis]WDR34819.1 pilus assembly protein TadG-related protein [Pseudomonas serboccidentalis]
MSPRSQFNGPARQHGAIGLMAAATLSLALVLMLLVVDTGRLYMEQRSLQRVVDSAALEAVSRGGNCQSGLSAATYAGQSAVRNGYVVDSNNTLATTCGSVQTAASGLRTFTADATRSTAVKVAASRTVTTSFAGGVQALFTGSAVSLNTTLNASAVAAQPTPTVAQLNIRSTLASINTAQSNILNPLFSGLLGGNVNLTAVGWDGLLNTDINLLSYLNQLAINLNVAAGNYTQLLNTQATVTQLIQAAATVVQLNGATAEVITALGQLQVAAANAAPVKLGDILQLQTGTTAAGLDANLQLLQLIQGVVQLANSKSAVAATLPISVLGLANVTVRVKVIEPPQFSAIGDPARAKANPLGPDRIYVRTAQVRTMLSVNLPVLSGVTGLTSAVLGLVGTLTPTLNALLSLNLVDTLNSVVCLLGAGCEQLDPKLLPSPQIDIALDAGGAKSYVTDYSCPTGNTGTKSLTAHTITSIADLKLGKIDPTNAFSSAAEPTVAPLPLVDLGIVTCHRILGIGSCDAATHVQYDAGGIAIKLDTSVAQNTQDLVFSSGTPFATPPNLKLPSSVQSAVPTNNIVGSLSNTLAGINLIVYQPVGSNPLGAIVTGVASLISEVSSRLLPAVTGVVSPLLDPLLNNLLKSLGINLMDVDVGANMTCGQTGKAYLVI